MTESICYEIQVQEQLDEHWSAWFDGLALARGADNTTVMRGPVEDQAALHGILGKARDLGLTLISVRRLDPAESRTKVG